MREREYEGGAEEPVNLCGRRRIHRPSGAGQGRTEQGHGQCLQIKLGIGRSWAATYKTLSKNNFHGNKRKKANKHGLEAGARKER